MNDRAASETVGFVLAFVLVTATIGAVYATGIEGLYGAQRFEQVNNAERAFDVLADNVADLHREGAPSRATELRLGDASLGFEDSVTIRVRADDSASAANETYTMHARPFVYSGVGDSEIVYVGGAVFRTDGDAGVMRREPGFTNDSRRAVVPFVVTYPRGKSGGISTDSTALVVAHRQSSSVKGQFASESGADVRVNVTVESPRAAAWKRYFEAKGMRPIDTDASDGSVTYQFHTKRLIVPETVVEMELKR